MGCNACSQGSVWDEDLVRDDLRAYILETLGTLEAILVIDETSMQKRGKKSAGVQIQHCGTTGERENCQVGVFLSYVTARGHTLLDRELYVPNRWFDDPGRCREAGIPEMTRFQTKCELASLMVERIVQAQIPIRWVVADCVYCFPSSWLFQTFDDGNILQARPEQLRQRTQSK
jgi:SRSO17 transposase